MESKKWWRSKAMWAGIVGVIVAVYNSAIPALAAGCGDPAGLCVHIPAIPDWTFAILGAFGVYGRATATTTIK